VSSRLAYIGRVSINRIKNDLRKSWGNGAVLVSHTALSLVEQVFVLVRILLVVFYFRKVLNGADSCFAAGPLLNWISMRYFSAWKYFLFQRRENPSYECRDKFTPSRHKQDTLRTGNLSLPSKKSWFYQKLTSISSCFASVQHTQIGRYKRFCYTNKIIC